MQEVLNGEIERDHGSMKDSDGAPTASAAGLAQVDVAVDQAGQSTCRIPIEAPPGVANQTPRLELVYRSLQGNGLMGVGWSCDGLSAIARCKPSYAVDGFTAPIAYGGDDRYSLDGQRLINVQGGYGQPGSVYYTELQTWSHVKESGGGFVVTMRNGDTMEYGASENSRIRATGGGPVRVWALSAVSDKNGNRIEYSYINGQNLAKGAADPGTYYPDEIRYTVRRGSPGTRSIKFFYEDRPDSIVTYQGGAPVIETKRLKRITTSLSTPDGVTDILSYLIHYETSAATQLSRVIAIEQAAGASAGSPGFVMAKMLWTDTPAPGFGNSSPISSLNQPGSVENLVPMDVTGSGRSDMVHFWTKDQVLKASIYLASATPEGVAFNFASNSPLDAFPPNHQMLPADVDGDGKTDLVVAFQDRISRGLSFSVFLASDAGFVEAPGSPFITGDPWAMDANGDGRTDIVEAFSLNGALAFRSYLSLFGQGSGFAKSIVSTTEDPARPPREIAFWAMDVNGDGMMDLVRVWRASDDSVNITSYISAGPSIDRISFASRRNTDLGAFGLEENAFLPVDVNGDGIQDLLHVWRDASGRNLHLTTYLCDAAGGFVDGPDSVFRDETIDLTRLYPMGMNGGGKCRW